MNELFQYAFFRYALAGLAIISIASAMIGTYIVTRRMVSISGGVTHACFGGLGLGYYLGWNPVVTAALFAVASSLGVELMAVKGRVREDSAIAVVWAIGMAVGILFVFLTPGYVPELNSFLFGNVLTISRASGLSPYSPPCSRSSSRFSTARSWRWLSTATSLSSSGFRSR